MFSKMLLTIILAAVTAAHATAPGSHADGSEQKSIVKIADVQKLMEVKAQEPSSDSTPFDQDDDDDDMERNVALALMPMIIPQEATMIDNKPQMNMALPPIVQAATQSLDVFGPQQAQVTITQSMSSTLVPGQSSYLESQASVQDSSAEFFSSLAEDDQSIFSRSSEALQSIASSLSEASFNIAFSQTKLSASAEALQSQASANSAWAHSLESVASTSAAGIRASAAGEANPSSASFAVDARLISSWILKGSVVAAVVLFGLAVGL